MHKVDTVQRKYTELLGEQRRLDKENAKNKKKAELFQKEKDQYRSDLTKTTSVKDKLEKLCRELQKDNKKLKVETFFSTIYEMLMFSVRTSNAKWKMMREQAARS